jgi:hypothetical protein
VQVNEKGGNTWVADEKGNEAYVTIIPGQEPKLRKILRQGHGAVLSVTNQKQVRMATME